MEIYHYLITEKSFKLLQTLRRRYRFILIGGWAVFLYAHSLKSKDIDLIIDYKELAKLKNDYDVIKNERLKKYEIKQDEIDIDIYLPHYSDLGIEILQIQKNCITREGFTVPQVEILLLLKLYAHKERQGSLKGKKDEIDILSLARLPEFDWLNYLKLVKTFNFKEEHQHFLTFLKVTRRAPDLNINDQQMAKLKKHILSQMK